METVSAAIVMIIQLAIVYAAFILLAITVMRVVYETVSFYWLIPRRIQRIMAKQGVYGPSPVPLLGNLKDMARLVASSTYHDLPSVDSHDLVPRLLPHYVLWSKQYGKRFVYWNGFEPRMCLTDPDMIKELLSKYSTISGKSWLQQQGSKNFIGQGLLMANGENWHRQRHLVSPAFRGDRLKSYASHMVECTRNMIDSMMNRVSNEGKNREIEIGEEMSNLTADIISRVEFGGSYEKGKKIFNLLTLLQRRCAQASRHLCFPGSRFFPSKYNKDIKSLKSEVETLLMEIIDSRRGSVEIGRSDTYGNDLLGILLNEMLHINNTKKIHDNKTNTTTTTPESLNLQLIMDECKTFFFAGNDTVALLLTWTVMLLASNPTWQDRLREEVVNVCGSGDDGSSSSVNVDHLPKLSVLNMIINESLRLYPPATILPRMAFSDIPLGDITIPTGLSIWIPVLAIHHDKELWGHDADKFNPDRFSSKNRRSTSTSGRFFPFGAGPRNCVGQTFALMEAKIILAMMVKKFKFTLSESYRHAPVVVLTVKPKYGVQVVLEPLS